MKIIKKVWFYFLVCILSFYLLFLAAKAVGSEMLLILALYPCFTMVVSIVFGIRNGFTLAMPLAVAAAFAPALFYLFSLDFAAWGVYTVVYVLLSAAGCGLGKALYRPHRS
jgi:hypothetical protein